MPNIPDSMKKAAKSEASGNILIVGRLMYASFFTAVPPSRNERDPKKFQYGATLLIPAEFDTSVLEAEINAVAAANLTPAQQKTTKWKNPLLKTADTGSTALYADEYPTLIRPNAKQFERKSGKERAKPQVIDGQKNPVAAEHEAELCYNGKWARLSIQPYWYPGEDGKPGVGLGLVNAQLLWNDDPLAGGRAKAANEFEAVDDMELAGIE